MHHHTPVFAAPTRAARSQALRVRHAVQAGALAAACAIAPQAQAVDYGPFTLNGFVKAEFSRVARACSDCQVAPGVGKDYLWADSVAAGKRFGTEDTHVVLAQPWLGVKFDLGKGFKLSGLVSQRWRDGKVDIPGFWYDRNIALSHEDYGRVAVGAMTSRAWSLADYPYGNDIGVSDVWASSGAGYGLLGHAVRVTSRVLDVMEGDLVLELTYDQGNRHFKVHKPRFLELYAQYRKGDLFVDAIYQDSRNGTPAAWGHGPFDGPFYDPAADAKLGQSGQSIAMLMARYRVSAPLEVLGGIRRNRWSGAHAVVVQTQPRGDIWNSPFNVDWGGTMVYRNADGSSYAVPNPGYPAVSVDVSGGVIYRTGAWSAHTGFAYLGEARTKNPSERGQRNYALVNTLGLGYDFGNGLKAYGLAGAVQYKRIGLSPMSMPGNASFTNVDSRVSRHGNWIGAGAVYTF